MIAASVCFPQALAPQHRIYTAALRTQALSCFTALPRQLRRSCRRNLIVRAANEDEEQKKIEALEESLKKSGLDRARAQEVLNLWKSAGSGEGGEITPEELRKVLTKQGSRLSLLVVIQILLDLGAAYGAYVGGLYLGGAAEQYGLPATLLQAVAFLLCGYYATGAFFDVFKLGMLLTAIYQFNVNSAAFLAAVKDLAGESSGLSTVDKAVEAVNTLRVVAGLNRMSDLLKQQQAGGDKGDMLRDLGAYLTLEKASRLYGFDSTKYGISDQQAAEIATVFSAYDADDNGVLSLDEFQKLCAKFAPELSAAEVKAGLDLLDKNGDGIIQLGEFVDWWLNKVQPPSEATAR